MNIAKVINFQAPAAAVEKKDVFWLIRVNPGVKEFCSGSFNLKEGCWVIKVGAQTMDAALDIARRCSRAMGWED